MQRIGSGRPGAWCSIANRRAIPALPAARWFDVGGPNLMKSSRSSDVVDEPHVATRDRSTRLGAPLQPQARKDSVRVSGGAIVRPTTEGSRQQWQAVQPKRERILRQMPYGLRRTKSAATPGQLRANTSVTLNQRWLTRLVGRPHVETRDADANRSRRMIKRKNRSRMIAMMMPAMMPTAEPMASI